MADLPTIQLIIPTRGLPLGMFWRHDRQDDLPVLAFCTLTHLLLLVVIVAGVVAIFFWVRSRFGEGSST